jgi:hypothetical protein
MKPSPIETIEFEKLVDGRPIRCSVVIFDDFACLVSDDMEITFSAERPDFREHAASHAERLGYVRVPAERLGPVRPSAPKSRRTGGAVCLSMESLKSLAVYGTLVLICIGCVFTIGEAVQWWDFCAWDGPLAG